jgi:hypothetical protein
MLFGDPALRLNVLTAEYSLFLPLITKGSEQKPD